MTDKKSILRLMFINLTKLTKLLTRENSLQQVLFHFSSSMGNIRSFSIKNLGQYKKLPCFFGVA